MKMSCSIAGAIWRSEGRRQDQSLGMEKVPSVVPAAIIAPAYCMPIRASYSHQISYQLTYPRFVEQAIENTGFSWIGELGDQL